MDGRTTIGIDASRNRSGGAKHHLVGILKDSDPRDSGIEEVHVWSYPDLLEALPERPWLVKHSPLGLEGSLLRQAWWQYRSLPGEVRRAGCQVLLNTDAGTVCPFRPAVTMSRDMLSYEKGEMERYGISKARLRLFLLKHVQARSLRKADGAVFLTRYAAQVIQGFTGALPRVEVIPHGVSDVFRSPASRGDWEAGRPVRALYLSNAAWYKHQWMVVEAVGELRRRGRNITLHLAGGGSGPARRRMDEAIARTDPRGEFISVRESVRHEDVPALHASADLFIFASSCENMPITLLEAMAAGLPIACSDRGPMPEVLADGGLYFDPEDPGSIAGAVDRLLADRDLRVSLASRARSIAEAYSWKRCGNETFRFLAGLAAAGRQTAHLEAVRAG